MLNNLRIENIAVIEEAEIAFSNGLNVLTGETGAGKSIVVDAINAVLGERTSKELVRHGANNAFVSAFFEDINTATRQKLSEMGIACEEDNTLVISRKISAQGKSACRINGTPSTVSMLKELGKVLVNIHGQHDSQALLNADEHYRFVDMTGDDPAPLATYRQAFQELVAVRRRLKSLTADADTKDRRLELLDYQIKELSDAEIRVGERESLKQRKELVQNAKALITALSTVTQIMNGDDETAGIQQMLYAASKELETLAVDEDVRRLTEALGNLYEGCESAKDMAQAKLNAIDFSDDELEKIEERLDMLYRLSSKYGETEEAMLAFLDEAVKERAALTNADEELEKLNREYDSVFEKTVAAADRLSAYRQQLAAQLERDVKEQLAFLDMPKIQFTVQFEKGNLSSIGYDKIAFLISTNPGEPPKPLSKIASGGELSRIMLAIKNIVAQNDSVDTLIFDEIDTGVSGRASRKIGLKLKSVSAHTQVICVTHSAQIAAAADHHFLIEKEFNADRTYTKVTPLGFEERKRELARIMGGLEITDNLLKSAEELLNETND